MGKGGSGENSPRIWGLKNGKKIEGAELCEGPQQIATMSGETSRAHGTRGTTGFMGQGGSVICDECRKVSDMRLVGRRWLVRRNQDPTGCGGWMPRVMVFLTRTEFIQQGNPRKLRILE